MTVAECLFWKSLRRWSLRAVLGLGILALLFPKAGAAQVMEGELRVTVRDPSGRAVAARIEVVCRNPQFKTAAQADVLGQARLPRLPQGVYRLVARSDGFEEFVDTIEVRDRKRDVE